MQTEERYPFVDWKTLINNYPNTWMLLFNPVSKDTGLKAESGYLVYQHKEKNNVLQKSLDSSLWENINDVKSIGIFYTRALELADNQVICLGL